MARRGNHRPERDSSPGGRAWSGARVLFLRGMEPSPSQGDHGGIRGALRVGSFHGRTRIASVVVVVPDGGRGLDSNPGVAAACALRSLAGTSVRISVRAVDDQRNGPRLSAADADRPAAGVARMGACRDQFGAHDFGPGHGGAIGRAGRVLSATPTWLPGRWHRIATGGRRKPLTLVIGREGHWSGRSINSSGCARFLVLLAPGPKGRGSGRKCFPSVRVWPW